jgi:hypothetical protein
MQDKTEHMSAAEYRELISGKSLRRNKYNAAKTEFDGKVYDSKKEAARAAELKLLQKAGEIMAFAEQVTFLLPAGVKYIADFVIIGNDLSVTVEDVKGFKTDVYKLKKKLMEEVHGIRIKET